MFENIDSESFNKQLITLDANQQQDINYADSSLIFNQISNPDTHMITLSKANKLIDALNTGSSDKNANCINHPSVILKTSRHVIVDKLSAIEGVTIAKTIHISKLSGRQIEEKLAESDWQYPVIIRQCGDHDGRYTEKLNDPADIDTLSYTYFETDCHLTQYIDYAEQQNIYRKLRIAVIDGEFFLRHVLYSDHWKISSDARGFMKKNSWYFEHEKKLLESFDSDIRPAISEPIKTIHKKIGLDYFAIDCALDDDMNLLVFNINPAMNLLSNNAPTPNIWTPAVDQIKHSIIEMINKRLKE